MSYSRAVSPVARGNVTLTGSTSSVVGERRICPRCRRLEPRELPRCDLDGATLLRLGQPDDERLLSVLDDKLTLIGRLGSGGMGAVYRAVQHSMEREVAVKLLHEPAEGGSAHAERFLQEARAASRITHPNVVSVIDFGRTGDGELYLAMELVRGPSLAELLDIEQRLDPKDAIRWVAAVCEALHAAHTVGIVHRDIKPANVVVVRSPGGGEDIVKVLDFGIAKHEDASAARLTATGTVCGTPAYMSPEQALGEPTSPQSDVYSTAALLFELLTGTPPYAAEAPLQVLLAHVNAPVPSVRHRRPELSEGLDRVLQAALAKRPEERPATALAFKAALLTVEPLATGPASSPALTAPALPQADTASRRRWGLGLAGAALLGGTLVVWSAWPPAATPVTPRAPEPPSVGATPIVWVDPRPSTITPESRAERRAMETSHASLVERPATTGPVHLTSTPTGARVAVDGVDEGLTPVDLKRPPTGESREVVLSLAGHRERRFTLRADSANQHIGLTPRPAPRPGPKVVE